MNIKPSDVVLEIGSGNNPNPRSNILCDRFLWDNEERAGKFPIVIDRPMIVADGYHLPFPDKSFDYVICSHILEHMDDPHAFVREVSRVGKRGYIEVPSALSERIFGWDFHHWYCTVEKGGLVMRKKTSGEQFGGFFHRLIAQTIWFRRFFEAHEGEMYVKYEWSKAIHLKVVRQEPGRTWVRDLDVYAQKLLKKASPEMMADVSFYIRWMWRRAGKKAMKMLRLSRWRLVRTFAARRTLIKLIAVSRCPGCKSTSLMLMKQAVRCDHCRVTHPITQKTIPVFLSKQERLKGY